MIKLLLDKFLDQDWIEWELHQVMSTVNLILIKEISELVIQVNPDIT